MFNEPTPLTPEELEVGLDLLANVHEHDVTSMRQWCYFAEEHAPALLREVRGLRAAYALLQKGMESQAELMDGLKQQTRDQAAELARLRDETDGTDHFAGDPSKWGLKAMLQGACEQRDMARALAAKLAEVLADTHRFVDPEWEEDGCADFAKAMRDGRAALAEARAAGLVPGKGDKAD